MADSFYGGKQGVSFTIKKSFKSVDEMQEAFSAGGDYTDVWYGEYCLIDTINKNHEDNGKIYKRGIDYQNASSGHGAIYVGQIVGPSSGTPYFQAETLDFVREKANIPANGEDVHKVFPTGKDEETGKYTLLKNTDPDAYNQLGVFDFSTENHALVPGKDGDHYNDTIRYSWVNIREDNADSDSWYYIGFEIPYTVIDYTVHMTSAYNEDGSIRTSLDEDDIHRIDQLNHPFYEQWDLPILKGIKGDTCRNLRVVEAGTFKQTNDLYPVSAFSVDPISGELIVGAAGSAEIQECINNNYDIVIFDYYAYDEEVNPTPYKVFVAKYNIIDGAGIQVAKDGTLTVDYTAAPQTEYKKLVKWIDSVNLNRDNGKFTLTFNNEDQDNETNLPLEVQLDWIQNIVLDEDGTVHFIHAEYEGSNHKDTQSPNRIRWIKEINYNTTDGGIDIIYNTTHNEGNNKVNDIVHLDVDWIKKITISEETGEIALYHSLEKNNPTKDLNGNAINPPREILDAKLKLITGARVNDKGELIFSTNTGENITVASGTGNFILRSVTSVEFEDTNINSSRNMFITYSNSGRTQLTTNPINSILDIQVDSDRDISGAWHEGTWNLYVLYAAPAMRYPENGDSETNWVRHSNILSIFPDKKLDDYGGNNNNVWWRNFGSIKDRNGLLAFTVVDDKTIDDTLTQLEQNGTIDPNTPRKIENYLNIVYPSSGPGGGKMIGYRLPNTTVEYYMYDYNRDDGDHWVSVGSISESSLKEVKVKDVYGGNDFNDMATNGIIFLLHGFKPSKDPLPQLWSAKYEKPPEENENEG